MRAFSAWNWVVRHCARAWNCSNFSRQNLIAEKKHYFRPRSKRSWIKQICNENLRFFFLIMKKHVHLQLTVIIQVNFIKFLYFCKILVKHAFGTKFTFIIIVITFKSKSPTCRVFPEILPLFPEKTYFSWYKIVNFRFVGYDFSKSSLPKFLQNKSEVHENMAQRSQSTPVLIWIVVIKTEYNYMYINFGHS